MSKVGSRRLDSAQPAAPQRRRAARWPLAGSLLVAAGLAAVLAGGAVLAGQPGLPRATLTMLPAAVADDLANGLFGAKGDGSGREGGSGDGTARDPRNDEEGRPVPCSPDALIEAIDLANAGSGATLRLARGCTYTLTANQDGNGLPVIGQPITINGNDATIVRAAGAQPFRIFDVGPGGDLTLRRLTVSGGQNPDPTTNGAGISVRVGGASTLVHTTITHNTSLNFGGGIFNAGTTTVVDSTVADNAAGDGGGIFTFGSLTVVDSRLTRNNAEATGGGVAHYGTKPVAIDNTTLSHNIAGQTGGGFFGDQISAPTTVTRSTIGDNTSGGTGGGITTEGRFTLTHSTVGGNTAAGNGGGIENVGPLTAVDVRITGNTARANGGGLFNQRTAARVLLRRSEVSANDAIGGSSQAGGIFNNGGSVALVETRVSDNGAMTLPGGIGSSNSSVTVGSRSVVVANRPTNCVGSAAAVPRCFG